VIATLGVMLGSGSDLEECVRVANRAAGIVVGKFGTAVVSPEELFDGVRDERTTNRSRVAHGGDE
jgi:D-glycero-beta-D-manno-heptose-7-phosphate kinase